MNGVMNQDVHGMIRESAHAVGDDQTQPPITEAELPKNERERRLQTDHGKGYQERPGISAHQLPNLGMRLDDGTGPAGMRVSRI